MFSTDIEGAKAAADDLHDLMLAWIVKHKLDKDDAIVLPLIFLSASADCPFPVSLNIKLMVEMWSSRWHREQAERAKLEAGNVKPEGN